MVYIAADYGICDEKTWFNFFIRYPLFDDDAKSSVIK